MEAYAAALTYAIPGFVLLILIEAFAAWMMGKPINRAMDLISSLSSGMTNTLKSMLGLGIAIVSYVWMFNHFAMFEIESTAWLYFIAFIGQDFASYWSHRFNHSVNLFWNRHIVHHSSEEFNMACALRQEISAYIGIYFFLYIPLAFIGVPPTVIAIVGPIHLFAQFWYHTRLINNMGFLEHIIVTPSHHRVHHAINDIYIDKNFAAILIVWDKWFGTFQEELKDEPPVYGTLKPANTWNPVIINLQHFWQLVKDAWHASSLWDKARIWFMPTGWRPADVQEKYPIHIPGVHTRKKYNPPASNFLKTWSWIQLFVVSLLMYYMLTQIAELSYENIVLYSLFLFVTIFAYTTVMDRHVFAIPAEIIKLAIGVFVMYQMGGWFSIDEILSGASIAIGIYLGISLLLTFYFTFMEKIEDSVKTTVSV